MRTSEAINELTAAMAKAQAALKPASKDATNPMYKSKYADISSIWDAIRAAFPPHGLAIFQDVTTTEAGVAVETRISHTSGQWIEFGPLVVPMAKRDAHGVGSATSYSKKYALAAAVGLSFADEDDDGNHAVSGSNGATRIDPRDDGETLTTAQQKHAQEFAAGFRKLLGADMDEAEKSDRIRSLRDEANESKPVFVAAWAILSPAERRAVKTYIDAKVAA